ncbi:MAG: hypothetical protein HYU36_09660 [Planctomycetes bacterium]|nr:hypothetical protein [Planctomycetota bacterium]
MSPSPSNVFKSAGIVGVTRNGPRLVRPRDTPAGEKWIYQLPMTFQVAPRLAAAAVNICNELVPYTDFEVAADIVPFDGLASVRSDRAVPLVRGRDEPNPNTTPPGRKAFMSMYPGQTGFVPFGAKRADGTPYPHAGTGFVLTCAVAKDMAAPFTVENIGGYFLGSEAYSYHELHQLASDGTTLHVLGTERILSTSSLLPGWYNGATGLANAIPVWRFS